MPPLDSWLEFTFQTPFFVLILALILLTCLVAGIAFVFVRMRNRIKKGTDKVQKHELLEARWDQTRQAYHHFIYNLSHEVSNPLQSIQTNLDNMGNCPPGDVDRWHQYHSIITSEVGRLGRLNENLRLLSHLETPDAPILMEPFNMKGVIEEVIISLYERAESQKVRLRYVGPNHPLRVLGNRDHLHQVLMNLVDNGIKYSHAEGGDVIISAKELEAHLRIRISDEGQEGMSAFLEKRKPKWTE